MTCRHIPQVSSSSLPSLSSSSSPLQCHYSTSNNTTTTTTRKTKKCSKFSLSSPSSSSSSSSSSLYTNNNNKSISTTTITITKDCNRVIYILIFIIVLYSNLLVQYTTNANVLDQRELDSLKWVINQYGMGAPLDSSACNNLHFPYFSCQFVRGFYRVVRIEYEENNQIFQDNIDTTITELYFPDLERFYLYTDPFLEPSKNILSLLQNMPYLVDLRIRNQMRLTIIPDKFPFESKSLEVFRFTNNAAKEITNFNSTFYPKLKDFEFSIISSIPNDFGRGMTSKITVNVKSGSNLAPDSLCNVSSLSVQSYYPGLTSGYVANCFLCYLNIAPVHIHPQPVIPPLLDCPSIISVTGIRYTASKITIYGTNLGWAVQGDVDYLLTAIVPNSILEYGVNPLSPKFAASISEGDHPLASLSANRDTLQLFLSGSKGLKISVPLYKISLDDVVTRQESFSISVEMQVFFNPNLKHTFLFDGQPICSDLQPPLKPGILSCRVPILPTGGEQFNITVLNDYESSTFISTFTLEYPIVTVTNHISPKGGILELYGHFGDRTPKSLTIQVNYVCCTLIKMSENEIRCRLASDVETEQKLQPGKALLIVSMDGYEFQSKDLLAISYNIDSRDTEFQAIEDYEPDALSSKEKKRQNEKTKESTTATASTTTTTNANQKNLSTILQGASSSSLAILFSEFMVIVLLLVYIIYNRTRSPSNLHLHHRNKKQERSMV